jgi:hypothetical protein
VLHPKRVGARIPAYRAGANCRQCSKHGSFSCTLSNNEHTGLQHYMRTVNKSLSGAQIVLPDVPRKRTLDQIGTQVVGRGAGSRLRPPLRGGLRPGKPALETGSTSMFGDRGEVK